MPYLAHFYTTPLHRTRQASKFIHRSMSTGTIPKHCKPVSASTSQTITPTTCQLLTRWTMCSRSCHTGLLCCRFRQSYNIVCSFGFQKIHRNQTLLLRHILPTHPWPLSTLYICDQSITKNTVTILSQLRMAMQFTPFTNHLWNLCAD